MPEQAADRRDRVQPPGHRAGLGDVGDGQAQRVRRDRARDEDRDRDEHRDAEQRADEGARRDRVQRVDGEAEERVGDERHGREQHPGQQHDPVQPLARRVAVGEPAAVPVADRQRDEHDADRVRPDDRRRAEVRRQQPRRGDLRAEDAEPDHEDDQAQRGLGKAAHGARRLVAADPGRCAGASPRSRRRVAPVLRRVTPVPEARRPVYGARHNYRIDLYKPHLQQ